MVTTSIPHDEYSASAQWGMIDEVQGALAYALKEHARGKPVDARDVLEEAARAIRNAQAPGLAPLADVSMWDLLASYWEEVARRASCATTGLRGLNDALGGGLESKRLVVLLGPPGAGKTALAHQIADHVADSGKPVVYATSEDTPFTLVSKTLARVGQVNYTAVLKGWQSERDKIDAALAAQAERTSSNWLRYIDATAGASLEQIKPLAAAHFGRAPSGQGLLVVDYLQRFARAQRELQAPGRDLREVVTLLTEQLRALACELDCCVLALSSQNRAGYNGGGGNALASGKESGDIEFTADVLLSLAEDTARKPGAPWLKARTLTLLKNRQGETKPLALDWRGERQQFIEVE